jgi:hypothetical protein
MASLRGPPQECQVLGTASLLTSDDQLYSPVCGQTGVARVTCSSQVARGKSSGSHPSRECMSVFFSAGQSGDFTCRMILGRRHTAIPKEQRHIVSSLPTVQCNATGYAAPFRGRRHTLAWVEGDGQNQKANLDKYGVLCIPLKPKDGLTPISCHAVLERPACAFH